MVKQIKVERDGLMKQIRVKQMKRCLGYFPKYPIHDTPTGRMALFRWDFSFEDWPEPEVRSANHRWAAENDDGGLFEFECIWIRMDIEDNVGEKIKTAKTGGG